MSDTPKTGPRIIVRIEITEGAKDNVEKGCDRYGMTQVAMLSRLVEWFAGQPETVRATVLGHFPLEGGEDAARQVIKAMAGQDATSR